MAKDKRHCNVLSLDTIINLYFVIIVFFQFQNLANAKTKNSSCHENSFSSTLLPWSIFSARNSCPMCRGDFFFSGETVIWNSPNFWSRWRTKRNTRDASMMVKLLGLMFCFFFPFLLDDWTWKLHQAAFPWGHSRKSWKKMVERKLWWVDFPQHFDRNLVFSAAEIAWSQRLFCDVALPCLMVYDCKGCANWSQSPSKVPAVPPGTQAAWAGGTRGCMKPSKISGARLVRWVWEAHLPWLAAYLSKRTAESIMRSRKTDPISRHHPDSVFSSLILIVFTMNRWHSSTTLCYSDVFSNCDFPIHWQVKHCSHEDPMASEWRARILRTGWILRVTVMKLWNYQWLSVGNLVEKTYINYIRLVFRYLCIHSHPCTYICKQLHTFAYLYIRTSTCIYTHLHTCSYI